MGVGLIFLLVRSTNEFNKMTELRKEMEVLLRDVKFEIQKKDAVSTHADSRSISFFVSDCSRNKNTSGNYRSSLCAIRTHCPTEFDGSRSKCEIISESTQYLKMDQMEAELEAEFQRLRLGLEDDNSSVLPQHLETQVKWKYGIHIFAVSMHKVRFFSLCKCNFSLFLFTNIFSSASTVICHTE